ncbi:hypothetical protein COU78_02915 [Candidatus Peregrinibacteria bacterium CG10_big_fil_rev_8_21_14_0_10_49_24]|nr:MAG: hypothetical protein COV83_06750 [Candidatus Peregrinibacteria bacterium CG11_big_fil_rev_8_21_14_0_20_49_14]PIR51080.1 MAG: hypothetical protein COU78_02915 [Candidatus Peregrinibacteria bacterium CG10_big_fil_rev_8_21_14_0_10_49_24]PJA67633.1 MAG: hypothetical protein CO157_04395 [Candidatus Peregrinibacteria bacterium CG_4_9_14_3_um_filter_49_12]
MLFLSTHKDFAFQLNPEREHRLLRISGKDDTGGTGGLENGKNDPEDERLRKTHQTADIGNITSGIGSRITSGVLSAEKLDSVLSQPSGIIAFLENSHSDLRKKIEDKMRAAERDYYADNAQQENLPMHEILWYLREHETDAAELRAVAAERLRDPDQMLRFTGNLSMQIQKLQDIEGSLTTQNIGMRLGNVDAARLQETQEWLAAQCRDHGLGIESPVLTDWIAGKYADFQPEKSEVLRVIQYITGSSEQLPTEAGFDTTGAPEAERLRERLNARIRAEHTGGDNDSTAVIDQATGTITRSHWTNRVRNALQALRKRKLSHLFLSARRKEEGELSADTLQEQISILEKQLIEMRTVLLENLKTRARVVRDRFNRNIQKQFGDIDAHSALERFGVSQALLGGQAIANAIAPLERIIFSPPSPQSPGFERYVENAHQTVDEFAQEDVLTREVETAKLDHQETVAWATHLEETGKLEPAIAAVQKPGDSPVLREMPTESLMLLEDVLPRLRRVAQGTASGEDFDAVEQEVQGLKGKQYLTVLLRALSSGTFSKRIEQAQQKEATYDVPNTAAERERVRVAYEEVKNRLAINPALQHTVCRVLHIEDGLREHFTKVRLNLAAADEHEAEEIGRSYLQSADDTVERLAEAESLLHTMEESVHRAESTEEFERMGSDTPDAAAFFNRDTGQIVLNMTVIRKRGLNEDILIHHEKGHAIVETLTRKTGLFEGLLIRTGELLESTIPANQLPGQSKTFRELLEKQGDKWMVNQKYPMLLERARKQTESEQEAEELASEWLKERLLDELLNKYGSWVEKGRNTDSTDPEHIALFRHIETTLEPEEAMELDKDMLEQAKLDTDKLEQDVAYDVGDEEGGDSAEGGEGGGTESGVLDINTDLISLRGDIEKIRTFYESYPEFKSQVEGHYATYDKGHRMILNAFQSGQTSAQNAKKAIKEVQKNLTPLLKTIESVRGEKTNLSKAGASGREGWRALFANVQFVSIMDVIKTFKQMGEDLKRIWERRGAAKQAALGLSLTSWIPKSIPYAGRMQDEFKRRDKESEQKEVNEWKEKLNDFDSYDLLDMLGQIRNRDQAKAIFILLTDRGRMDWNDENVWRTLNAFSIYNMPTEACAHDDILRDKWIQKLVSEIWDDKDLYTQWRQKNDGAVDSGKKNFTAVVDQLSNVKGGLEGELKNQLELWKLKEAGTISPDLNPHLYEEILDYSMRNGKMSMEQKLFYLVQGVACGLLSIDRLRTLAGEKGGILNRYPWIDYFYKKNNSLSEVKALGKRLWEDKTPFMPGSKTTMWLHLEVMRVESTRQRISKAISGTRAENLDHEDVPSLVANADWVNIDRMTGMVSGTREKLSPEAVRNAYTGFGTKFKALGRLVQLEEKGIARFTDKDLAEAAKSIVAYIHMDNIFTRNASKGDRPQLTWDVIDTQEGPSTSDLTVGAYRTPQNEFVSDIIKDSGFDFGSYSNVDETNLIRREKRDGTEKDRQDYNTKNQEERYEESKLILGNLQSALMGRPDLIKKKLKEFAGDFKEENYATWPGGWLTYENSKSYFEKRFASTA